MRNTSTSIEAKIFLHDTISRFPITYHNFRILQCTDMGPPSNDLPIHGDQIHVQFLYSTSDGLLDKNDQLQAVILRFAYDHLNPPISRILLCIFVKQHSKYRACDAEESRLQVDGVVRRRHPVRSDWNLKRRLFLIKNALF